MRKYVFLIAFLVFIGLFIVGCSLPVNVPSDSKQTRGNSASSGAVPISLVREGIVMPENARNVFLSMFDLFIKDTASIGVVSFMTTNHSLWHFHVRANVDYVISEDVFKRGEKNLLDMGYPKDIIAVDYGDYGGSLSMGLNKDGFSISVAYDKNGSVVIGMGFKAGEGKPQLGLDVSKMQGDFWQCVSDILKTANISPIQLTDDCMFNVEYQEKKMVMDFSVGGQITQDDIKRKILDVKSRYGGEYSEVSGRYVLEGAQCGNMANGISISASGGSSVFNIHVEWDS